MYCVEQLDYLDWQKHIKSCKKSNILQFWQYGNAKSNTSNWNAYRFLILNTNHEPVAMVQVMALEFSIFGGIARINRGPIFIGSYENKGELVKIFSAIFDEFKKRRWFFTQIAPETNNSNQLRIFFKNNRFKKLSKNPYASGLISLQNEESNLLLGLKKKWRYSLRRAQKSELNITMLEPSSSNLNTLIKQYNQLKSTKEFQGISSPLVMSLANQKATPEWKFNIFIANKEKSTNIEDCCGILVSVLHGDTSTYLIGITDKDGRVLQANYLLLWESIMNAKKNGCSWFDIGGLDSSTPSGISHFKNGLKSEKYSLDGEYRGFIFPWRNY